MTRKEVTNLSYAVTGCAIKVHKALGPGLLESIYEKCLKYELQENGFTVEQQLRIPILYEKLEFESVLKVDLFVNNLVVVELKAVEKILPIHEAQVISYMNLLKCPQGLLINFNTMNITKTLRPFVNKNYLFDNF